MDMNQNNLEKKFGGTPPSLTKKIAEIVDEGIIKKKKKNGKVLNHLKLKKLLIQ
jgi:hypothetical protein